MHFFKKLVGIVAILSIIFVQLPQISFAWQNFSNTKMAKATGITKHAPEFLAPPELKIPIEAKEPVEMLEKKKTNKWLWVGLGVLAAGSILAGAGGGGGGGGTPPEPSTGDITVKWND